MASSKTIEQKRANIKDLTDQIWSADRIIRDVKTKLIKAEDSGDKAQVDKLRADLQKLSSEQVTRSRQHGELLREISRYELRRGNI